MLVAVAQDEGWADAPKLPHAGRSPKGAREAPRQAAGCPGAGQCQGPAGAQAEQVAAGGCSAGCCSESLMEEVGDVGTGLLNFDLQILHTKSLIDLFFKFTAMLALGLLNFGL